MIPSRAIKFAYRSRFDDREDWAIIYPRRQNATWIVRIHGHGSNGDQLYVRQDIRDHWLPHFEQTGFGILTPNLRDNAWMSPAAAADLHDLLDFLRAEYSARRFILASGSMGGTSNLIYPVLHPDDVTAAIALGAATDLASYHAWCRTQTLPILKEIADAIESAYGPPPSDIYQTHTALAHTDRLTMPVYLAHGGDDAIIPVSQSRNLTARMAGSPNFLYHEIPAGNHDSPLWLMPHALHWVLNQI